MIGIIPHHFIPFELVILNHVETTIYTKNTGRTLSDIIKIKNKFICYFCFI